MIKVEHIPKKKEKKGETANKISLLALSTQGDLEFWKMRVVYGTQNPIIR